MLSRQETRQTTTAQELHGLFIDIVYNRGIQLCMLSRQETKSDNCTTFLLTQFRTRDIQLRMLSRQETRQTTTAKELHGLIIDLVQNSGHLASHAPQTGDQIDNHRHSFLTKCSVGRRRQYLQPVVQTFNYFILIDQKRNIGVSVPISTFMCLLAIYIFPRLVCLFCWRKYVDRSWDYKNRSQTHECGNWG